MTMQENLSGNEIEEEESLDIKRYIGLIMTFWWIIITLPVAGGLGAYFLSQNVTPSYEATTTILVQYRSSGFGLGASNFQQSEELASTYRRLLIAAPFLSSIELSGASVLASNAKNPPVIIVKVRHGNPVVAASTAQTIAEEFVTYAMEKRLSEIARIQSAAAVYGITAGDVAAAQLSAVDSLSILEPVEIPTTPVIPKTAQNTVLGGILGLMIAIAAIFIISGLEDTVRSPERLQEQFGVAGLGSVFNWTDEEGEMSAGPIILAAPTSTYAEAFRQFRANFEFSTASYDKHVYVVSSPGPSEGKTTVVSNLAVAIAQTGKKVLVVDGDLRRPSLSHVFEGMTKTTGLSNYLADRNIDASEVIRTSKESDGVDIISSGPIPPNPGELLASSRFRQLIEEITDLYDFILLDSPPLLPVADATVMASQVTGAMLIVDGQSTKSAALKAALVMIRNSKSPILGVVINKLKRQRFNYGYGYGYGYPYYRYYEYRSHDSDSHSKKNKSLVRRVFSKVFRR
jgi:capsular exopolysaccharide synthesis family protein